MRQRSYGGEFYFSPADLLGPARNDWLKTAARSGRWRILTRGGYHSLLYILRHLLPAEQPVLLPSYLCQAILTPFQQLQHPYRFYRVDEYLRTDLDDLRKLLKDLPASPLLMIDYFGFPPGGDCLTLLADEMSSGRVVIQDRSQSSLSTFPDYGAIVFNSLRKIGPADGSVLTFDAQRFPGPYPKPTADWLDRAARIKVAGQLLRWAHCVHGMGRPQAFLERFARNEHEYYRLPIRERAMLQLHQALFRRLPIEAMRERRRKNYCSLARWCPDSGMLFAELPCDVVPLFFTIRTAARDQLRQRLMARQVYTAIHWELPAEVKNTAGFEGSQRLARQIVAVPIDQRIDQNGIDHLGNLLARELKRTP